MTDSLVHLAGAAGCPGSPDGEHEWRLTGLHLTMSGAEQTFTCTGCPATYVQAPQIAPAPGHLEGVDSRPGLDFSIEDLTDEERRS